MLEKVNPAGSYQKKVFIIFALEWFLAGIILLCPPFLVQKPTYECPQHTLDCKEYVCRLPQNQRHLFIKFSAKNYNPLTREYELYCENEIYGTIIASSPYIGSFIGFLLFPQIADNYGRKICLNASWITCTIGSIILACSQNYFMAIAGFFITGFGLNPAITIHYSFFNEHSTGQFREYTSIAVQVAFGIGELVFVCLAYNINYWRIIAIFIFAIPIFLLNFLNQFVIESPKFVYAKDHRKTVQLFNEIAKINKKEQFTYEMLEINPPNTSPQNYTFSYIDLFKFKSLRMQSYSAVILFFSIQAVFYGTSFSMQSIGLDLYTNIALIAVSETIAYGITDLCIPYLKRKKTSFIGLFIAFILQLSFLLLKVPEECKPDSQTCPIKIIQIIIAMFLRFNVSFVWTVVYIYFSELYPTQVRSLALGITSTTGTLGAFWAPFLVTICQDQLQINPILGFSIFSIVGALHVLCLQETKGKALENQIQEFKITDLKNQYQIHMFQSVSPHKENYGYENFTNHSQ